MKRTNVWRPENAIGVRLAPLCEMGADGLPLAEILVDQPVNQLIDAAFNLPWRIGNDPIFELFLNAGTIEEIDDPSDAQRIFEERVTARLHFKQDLLDVA